MKLLKFMKEAIKKIPCCHDMRVLYLSVSLGKTSPCCTSAGSW